jgi:Terpene cyclase DEP1
MGGNGLNLPLFFQQLFANRIGAFFGMDLFVSAAVLLVFMGVENARVRIRWRWLAVVALVSVGVSLAFPLYLYMRELALEQKNA